jgi:hypothetical protein
LSDWNPSPGGIWRVGDKKIIDNFNDCLLRIYDCFKVSNAKSNLNFHRIMKASLTEWGQLSFSQRIFFSGKSGLLVFLLLGVLIFSNCSQNEVTSTLPRFLLEDTTSRYALDLPIDTLDLQRRLDARFGGLDFAQPIWIKPTDLFLIPIGKWKRVKHFAQVHGEHFRSASQFWPNPVEANYHQFQGDFENVILYNDYIKEGSLLLASNQNIADFRIVNFSDSVSNDYFLFSTASADSSKLLIISLNRKRVVSAFDKNQKVIDWSINFASQELIALVRFDDSSEKEGYEVIKLLIKDLF